MSVIKLFKLNSTQLINNYYLPQSFHMGSTASCVGIAVHKAVSVAAARAKNVHIFSKKKYNKNSWKQKSKPRCFV